MADEQDVLDPTANAGVVAAPSSGATSEAPPEVTESEKNAVKQWASKIADAKAFHKPVFDRMRECQKIAKDGHDKEWAASNYTVPVLKRHINVSVAALYARNPTATAKRKKQVLFSLWDGNMSTLQQAAQAAQPTLDPATGMPVPGDANAAAMLQEVMAAHQHMTQMDRAGKTLEILFSHYMNEQDAGYKQQLKAAVRRVKVCTVGWIKLGFQRAMEPNPDVTSKIADATDQIARLERLTSDFGEGKIEDTDAKLDELRRLVADLQSQPELIVREGPVLGFPKANQVIVDPSCVHLKTLAGANWLAQEYPPMSRDTIKELYGVDIGTNFTAYNSDKKTTDGSKKESLAIVWEVQNKKTQEVFTICEGYPAYIKAPAAPDVKISRFWTLFPIVFNEVEDDDQIYTDSDIWDARHMQREYNNVREGLREHRMQNRPRYATTKGAMEETDRKTLGSSPSGTVIELNGLQTGGKVDDLIQQIKTIPIDPNLYEVTSIFTDIERTIGSSQANLGATSNTTATQSSIIEQGRSVMNSDNVDDLDDVLTEVARSMGELMLLELDPETVKKIAGPGAVWPSSPPTRQQVSEEIWLEIKAGSSGRPNRAAELANMERGMPYMLQLPGMNPGPLARRYAELLDLDVEEMVVEGMPSIMAQNAIAGRPAQAAGGSGSPQAQDGKDQGPAGANNAPSPVQNEPGPQPAYGVPGTGMEVMHRNA